MNLGAFLTMTPRVPETCLISKEGNIPRICVSTHLYYCLRSITGGSSNKFYVNEILHEIRDDMRAMESCDEWIKRATWLNSPTVYISYEEAFTPPDACDFKKNHESWYITPQKFQRLGFIDLPTLVSEGVIKIIDTEHSIEGKYLNTQAMIDLKVVKDNPNKHLKK